MIIPVRVPFGEYAPDLPSLDNPGALLAKNVLPAEKSYKPFKGLAVYSNALAARARGAVAVISSTGLMTIFAGTETKLYSLGSGATSWTDVSRLAGGNYNADEHWSFVQFGDYIVAMNGNDTLQVFQLGVDSNFAALSGSPPIARYCSNAREQVMVGNISGNPNRVQWSGVDSLTTWGTNPSLQADFQDLQGPGTRVMAIVGRLSPHIWCDHSIWLATYVGPPIVWQIDRLEDFRGTLYPRSVVNLGAFSFGLCEDGFYRFGNDGATPIGQAKINKRVIDALDASYPDRINSAVDPLNQCIHWALPLTGHATGDPNYILTWHWPTGKWAETELTIEYLLLAGQSFGQTMESLDAISGSLDALAYSLDSRVWAATGTPLLSAFDTAHKLAFFTGTNLQATIDTQEVNIFPGKRGYVKRVWPLIEGTSVSPTVTPITRNLQHEATTTGTAVSVNSSGYAPMRSNARYQRARVIIPAGDTWTHAHGVEVEAVQAGRR